MLAHQSRHTLAIDLEPLGTELGGDSPVAVSGEVDLDVMHALVTADLSGPGPPSNRGSDFGADCHPKKAAPAKGASSGKPAEPPQGSQRHPQAHLIVGGLLPALEADLNPSSSRHTAQSGACWRGPIPPIRRGRQV